MLGFRQKERPVDPHDPRWLPSRRAAIAIGIAIQAVVMGIGVLTLLAIGVRPYQRVLVQNVLAPEDIVYLDQEYLDTQLGSTRGETRPPIDVAEAIRPTPAKLKTGEQLFTQNCASCHGPRGGGDGAAGANLNPKPRNFSALDGWRRGTRLSDIFRTISLGLPGTGMPAFEFIPPADRFAVAHYVMSFAQGHPADSRATLDSLDREFSLSAGTKAPNTIALSQAIDKMVAEAPKAPEADSTAFERLTEAEPRGSELYERAFGPRERATVAYWLTRDSLWVREPGRLKAIIRNGAASGGFGSYALTLADEDWYLLHRYLRLRYYGGADAGATR